MTHNYTLFTPKRPLQTDYSHLRHSMAVTVYVRERRGSADRAPESTNQRRFTRHRLSRSSRCTTTKPCSIAPSPIQACSSLPSDSRSRSARSGEQACGAERNRRRLHLSCVGRSSAPLMTSSARIGSVAASSPSLCCSRVVSVKRKRKPRNAELWSASSGRRGTFNQECIGPSCTPGLRSASMAVRGRGVLRAFDRGLLIFSRQQTTRPTEGATCREHLILGLSPSKRRLCEPYGSSRR